jgi:hypothetical protein
MEENYIKTSIRERILLQRLINLKNLELIKFSEDNSYDKWDAVIMSGNSICLVESKVRFYNISTFNDWIIEKNKYDFLIQESKKYNIIPMYINFHIDGIQIWNLNSIKEPIWTEQQLPKNSQDKNEEIKTKIVGELDGKLSEHIFININWISLSKEVQKIYTEKYGE